MKTELMLRLHILEGDYESFVDLFSSNRPSSDAANDLMIYASQQGLEKFMIYLLEEGVSVDMILLGGSSIITFAARSNMKNLLIYLLNKGVNINHQDEDGLTPLHASIIANNFEIVDFLLQSNADVKIEFMGDSAKSMMKKMKLDQNLFSKKPQM